MTDLTSVATDVGALQVWADQLQECGDPRGEFIALGCRQAEGQLSAIGRRRLFELRRDNYSKLLGNLRGLVTRARFKRGVLHSGALNFARKRLEECWADPMWSTLEVLELGWSSTWFREREADFLNSRPALHAVLNVGRPPLAPCPRVTTAALCGEPTDELAVAFPNLKRLAISGGVDSASSFWASPFIRGLEVVLITQLYPGSKLMWSKDTLHLGGYLSVEDEQLELIRAGPQLKRFEVPFGGPRSLQMSVEQEPRLGALLDAALVRGAELVFASPVRGYEARWDQYPAHFLPAVP